MQIVAINFFIMGSSFLVISYLQPKRESRPMSSHPFHNHKSLRSSRKMRRVKKSSSTFHPPPQKTPALAGEECEARRPIWLTGYLHQNDKPVPRLSLRPHRPSSYCPNSIDYFFFAKYVASNKEVYYVYKSYAYCFINFVSGSICLLYQEWRKHLRRSTQHPNHSSRYHP